MSDNSLCVFCNAPYTDKMIDVFNGFYGCDTGCEYLTFVIWCETCDRAIYLTGEFGLFENDKEKQRYIDRIKPAEIAQALISQKEVNLADYRCDY